MLKRVGGYLTTRQPSSAPVAAAHLEQEGYAVSPGGFSAAEVAELRTDMEQIYASSDGDKRQQRSAENDEVFRYGMFNRSAICQRAISHPSILDVIEPLLGEDCHVIANTAWRNPPGDSTNHGGQAWHIDAGPHVPLANDAVWPAELPHPVFAIGVHIYLQTCQLVDGPTGVIPGSHLSGRFPPREEILNPDLTWQSRGVIPLIAEAGDVAFFVSDIWHRRLPTRGDDAGRFFLQAHYGRRDIAQRVRPTLNVNHLSAEAIARAQSDREKTIIGIHPKGFYDG